MLEDKKSAHSDDLGDVVESLDTSIDNGLTQEEAEERKEKFGENKIEDANRRSWLSILLEQFKDYLVYILFIGAFLSLAIGLVPEEEPKVAEAAIIALIIFGNGLFGFYQDYKAEREIASLSELTAPDATVIRGGSTAEIDAKNVVPGDIIKVDKGDSVPADARLVEARSLSTSESALTGESKQVTKTVDHVEKNIPVADRNNMIFKSTNVVRGSGVAVVTETGMSTEIGQIADELKEADTKDTPFQREVDRLGRQLAYIISAFIVLLALIQALITGANILTIILLAIGLVVAAIPEALPVIVTFALALGSRRLAEKDAVVRRLPVVESLGSVNYILTDKTGTLTSGEMTVKRVYHDGKDVSVTGVGSDEDGEFLNQEDEQVNPSVVQPVIECGVYANDSEIDESGGGNPTETALLYSGRKAEVDKDIEVRREISFSSDRKRMTVVDEDGTAYMKGASDTILDRCDRILKNGQVEEMTDEDRERIDNKSSEYASNALRVLGFAKKNIRGKNLSDDEVEQGMVFLGLQAMIDPPREEVKDAIDDCRTAGVDVVMATGDDAETARAVGSELGFDSSNVITGDMVESMDTEELEERVTETEIFARVSPKHKVKVLEALQNQDYYVAMTGDGVNDAPALKNSDVGVSMGQRGTDVAKQSSDLVLLDDNFVTIRDAIEEGRTIFDNIRKVTNYLLSTNSVEVMLVFLGGVVTGLFYPDLFNGVEQAAVLSAVMILWVNFMTDGPPAIGLAKDSSVPEVMERDPRDPDETIIDKKMLSTVLMTATLGSLLFLPVFFFLATGVLQENIVLAQTTLFTILTLFELVMFHIIRREYGLGITSNKWLGLGILIAFIVHLVVLYTPLSNAFGVVSLGLTGWIASILPVILFTLLAIIAQNLLRRYVGARQEDL